MSISVADAERYALDLKLRLPFGFGIATLTELPHAFVRVDCSIDGRERSGIAAEHLLPKWFTKDPDRPLDEEFEDLAEVVTRACDHAVAAEPADTVFDFWRAVYDRQRRWAESTDHPPLLWGLGVSLIERAVIDAFCRATDTTFPGAVATNALGVRPGAIYDDLAGVGPAEYLPATPRRSLDVRHTVGHSDPLTADEHDGSDDDLPRTLEEVVDAYGVRFFKLKVTGDPDADHDRIRRVAEVVEAGVEEPAYTLDANESYESIGALRDLWSSVASDPDLDGFVSGLRFVEQPFPREIALDESVGRALSSWDGPPVIVDESDGRVDALATALDRGYAGTSYKGCKGVFKGLVNAGLLARRREAGEPGVLSAEDLTTIGPVGLLQDLAVVATLGIDHVERNGHHYFRGLSMFPEAVQERLLADHGDLYRRHEAGFATLDVTGGEIETGSVLDAPFGVASPIDPAQFTPLDDWTFDGG